MIEGDNEYVFVYQYRASKDYFIYVHDDKMTFDEFVKAVFDAAHDLLILLEKGFIFDRLADLFHSRVFGDKSFLVLTNLFGSGCVTGRLQDWIGAIRYINIRKSGLGDHGKWDLVEACLHIKKTLVGVKRHLAEPNKVAFFSNIADNIAGILFVIELAGGYWTLKTFLSKDIKDINEFKKQSWLKLNRILQGLYKFVMKKVAEISKVQLNDNLVKDNFNLKRICNQYSFWMDKEKYVPFLIQNKIPTDLYDPETEVFVDLVSEIKEGNITSERGYAPDGHESLGIVNGNYPIDDKMHYIVPLCPMWAAVRRDAVKSLASKCVEKTLVKRDKDTNFSQKTDAKKTEAVEQKADLETSRMKHSIKAVIELHKKAMPSELVGIKDTLHREKVQSVNSCCIL